MIEHCAIWRSRWWPNCLTTPTPRSLRAIVDEFMRDPEPPRLTIVG
jgi:hypothetical protein